MSIQRDPTIVLVAMDSPVKRINKAAKVRSFTQQKLIPGADLGGGCRGCAPPPRDDLSFFNTTGILQKKTMWFIGVEVEQETSAPPPKKNPGSAPEYSKWDFC